MTRLKISTTMAKHEAPKPFNTEKDIADGKAVANAPLVGGEFITEDNEWQGQTVEVQSDTHLEDDHGTGEHVIIRTFEFLVNPEVFGRHTPTLQDLFNDHKKGIAALLWQDGLTPIAEIDPRVVFSKDNRKYSIIVTARPSVGQAVVDKSFTLSELISKPNESLRYIHKV